MIYVSKTKRDAIDFVGCFLNTNWKDENDGGPKYINIGYSEIRNAHFRNFFVSEQNQKCCYCCRDIENSFKTELEHIIPKSKKTIDEFQPYYDLSSILQEKVVPQKSFEMSNVKIDLPPYPHHIAYHNIVASCDGRSFESSTSNSFTCCNRKRENDFVPPFNLMENSIAYLPDGTIVYTNDHTNRNYFKILNLDKTLLNQIRRLWFLFSKSNLNIEDIFNDGDTEESITEKIVAFAIANSNSPADDIVLTATFSNTTTWHIFKQYNFFFEYYRNNN